MSVAQWWAGVLKALGAQESTVEVPGMLTGYQIWNPDEQAWEPFGGEGATVQIASDGITATATAADGTTWSLVKQSDDEWGSTWSLNHKQADGSSDSLALRNDWIKEVRNDSSQATQLEIRGMKDAAAVEAAWNAVPRYAEAAVTGSADIPAAEEGSADVDLTFDATQMMGRSAVVFELVTRAADENSFEAVAAHADASDEGQSIYFSDAHIGTTATDSTDGDHQAIASTTTRITDTVSYTGLIPGVEHTMSGTLYDKATGQPVVDATTGNPVTASTTFTPEAPDGTVDVEFEFDSTGIAGGSAVAFEQCWRADFMCAEHSDLSDKDQTVDILQPPAGDIWDKTGTVLPIAAGAGALALGGAYALQRYSRRMRVQTLIEEAQAAAAAQIAGGRDE